MKVFITGATGYIGGSLAHRLLAEGHQVTGLVRSEARAEQARARGIAPLLGTLDDGEVLAGAARAADAVIDAASADHPASAGTLLTALEGSGKVFLRTSGTSIVGTRAGGERVEDVFDEDTPFTPSPVRVGRVALDTKVRAAGLRAVVIAPSLIYGRGHGVNPDSIQVPWLIALARKHGVPKHIGSGANIWSNVHIDDLVELYLLALDKAPAGAFYFAENGENDMREVCAAIGRMLGQDGRTESMTLAEAAAEWGEGPAHDTMGSNSRVRGRRARAELGWAPQAPSLLEEIERGCYADAASG
ncbi:MAG: NAD-dependent epimerase/dehydratase family protein [Proteobacteria bacterium]|nr:NAD-dependent epimerase/dehydratase family protein [Pseudomonadota bacterium]